jgi:serine/threonine-protein kinase RsbW
MKKYFKRDLNSLKDLFDFLGKFAEKDNLDATILKDISVAVEEIFTNLIKYNQYSTTHIQIDISKRGPALVITITDSNGKQFDITKSETYDTRQPLVKRPIGKVGLHLVKKLMDQVTYEFKDKKSKITLTKNLKESHVRH